MEITIFLFGYSLRSSSLRSITLYCIILLGSVSLYAQRASISGIVTDSTQKPLFKAMATLLSLPDSTTVKSTLTKADGAFSFQALPDGRYLLRLNSVGYTKYQSAVISVEKQQNVELPAIVMNAESIQMSEVVVSSTIPYIVHEADKTIVNVDASISNTGKNILEVLSSSPGVSVDQNGVVSMQGKAGVTLYIDDKPLYISGDQLQSYLSSLPASLVRQIEIMPTPPAKYEAAGNAGIINLRTHKSILQGIHGNASTSYSQGRYPRSNNSCNLNYADSYVGIFSNFGYNLNNQFQDLRINRKYKNPDLSLQSLFSQNTLLRSIRNSGTGRLSLDYYASENTIVGISANGIISPGDNRTNNISEIRKPDETLLSSVVANNSTNSKLQNGVVNLNLRHTFDSTGKSLTVDADYVRYAMVNTQVFKNATFNGNGAPLNTDSFQGNTPSDITIYAAKADYTHPVESFGNISAGWKTSYTKTDNTADYRDIVNDSARINYNLSNRFLYNEMINAAYLNMSTSYAMFDIQAGLRVESTSLQGKQLGNDSVQGSLFDRNYTNLFPTLYVLYKADSTASNLISFSYGRRIDRPFYQSLNPFVSPLDKFTYYTGNPLLNPTFSDNFSLSYIYNNSVSASLGYSSTRDGINESIEIRDGIYYSRPANISSTQVVNFSIDASIPVGNWLVNTLYGEVGQTHFKSTIYNQNIDTRATYGVAVITSRFQLGKGWSAELHGEATTNTYAAQVYIHGFALCNMGIQKRVLDDKGTLRLSVNDVFYSRKNNGDITNLNLTEADYNSFFDSRQISLTFSYRFGKTTDNKPQHNGSGSDDERNRIKS